MVSELDIPKQDLLEKKISIALENANTFTTKRAVLGALISYVRKQAGFKQNEIVNKLNSNLSSWSRIESGEISISAESLYELSKLTQVPMNYFFECAELICTVLANNGVSTVPEEELKAYFEKENQNSILTLLALAEKKVILKGSQLAKVVGTIMLHFQHEIK